MRLPTLFAPSAPRRAYIALPAGAPNDPPRGEAGANGDSWIADLMAGGPDVNPELTGRAKFDVYDEMAKTDPTIKSLLMFPSLHVRQAAWGLNPRDDGDPVDVAIRDAVAWQFGIGDELGQLDLSWDRQLAQKLQMLKWGAMFEEIVWCDPREIRTWRDADGDEHPIRTIDKLAPRSPTTINKVVRGPKGTIASIEQTIAGTKPIVHDERRPKLTYLLFEDEPGSWDGVSLLRPAWGAWRLKKHLVITTGIGWDRYATGLPVVWHPDNPDAEDIAKSIGRNLRAHERGYVHFPSDGPGMNGRPESEWFLEILNAAQTIADPTKLLRWCSEQEAEAGLQQFTVLGTTETGSRAVGDVLAEAFYMAVNAIADYLRREVMRQLICPFVAVNFGVEAAETRCPILTVSKIRRRDLETIAKAAALLGDAGFTFTDAGAEDDLRELFGWPALDRDELAERGVDPKRLMAVLRSVGLDTATLAAIVDQLPAELGIAVNRDEREEGSGLGIRAAA